MYLLLLILSLSQQIVDFIQQCVKKMKLKNLKKGDKGKKQSKTEEVKEKVEQNTNYPEDQQQKDDVLIDIQADLNKKEQPKKNVKARMESNKLVETEIDTSKYVIEKKQEEKKPINSWVVNQKDVNQLLAKDFKLHEVQHEFESLTDTKVNQQLKKKKQKIQTEKKTQNIGGMKFAPINIGGNLVDAKNTDKLVLGKPRTDGETSAAFTPTTLNFTNSKLNENVNVNVAPIEKTPQQIMQEEFQRKQKEREQQRLKLTAEINPPAKTITKGGWFKKAQTKQPIKQAPKIEFKSSPLTFTNSALNNDNLNIKPLQKSKQQEMMQRMQRADQGMKFLSKKQQEERRKKREEGLGLKIDKKQ